MAENAYFNHENLQGQSPFDRMREDDIAFSMAGKIWLMANSAAFCPRGFNEFPEDIGKTF